MKLLAFADSHNRPQHMLRALAEERGVDACFFLGDGSGDPQGIRERFQRLPLYTVHGNCDPASYEPAEGLAPFGGVLFYYTHGHRYAVKENLDALWQAARRKQADVALFGHTHAPLYECLGGVHLFNPGSIARPLRGAPSYGRITVEDGTPSFEIVPFLG